MHHTHFHEPVAHGAPLIPDYAARSEPIRRMSKLALLDVLVSVVASPIVIRFIPYRAAERVLETSEWSILFFMVPALLTLCLTLVTMRRLRKHVWLHGRGFALTALTLNLLSIAFFLIVAIGAMLIGGPE
ncbi:MAG: hypothetical protein QOF78_2602 [Phycisphaerales bacterium]|nr:hypothetical protein [Phycisphaerales bacterium]